MTHLTVRFRGIFTVVLRPDPSTPSVRILLPQGVNARLALGNRSVQIDRHLPFVAIPLGKDKSIPEAMMATPSGSSASPYQPNMICPIRTDIHPDYGLQPAGRGFARESVPIEDLLDCGLSDTDGQLYAVYFVPQHEIRFVVDARMPIKWDDEPIGKATARGSRPNPKSMQWTPDLRDFAPAIKLRPELLDNAIEHDAACAAYADFTTGEIVPFHNDTRVGTPHVHKYRFMHSAAAAREISDGVEVLLPVEGKLNVVLRNRAGREVLTVPIDPANGVVLVGNETIGDVLRYEPIPSCSDPAYEFELNYSLCEGEMPPRPVPVCAEPDDDHRDPPGTYCSKAMTVRVPKHHAERNEEQNAERSADRAAPSTSGKTSAPARGPIGFAVHLGVNDYRHNGPTYAYGDLRSAIFDATGFADLSNTRNFQPYSKGAVLTDADVVIPTIVDVVREAKSMLHAGDYFLMTFDGYGFNVPGQVQGWQLYRGFLSFPALYRLVSALADDVRVLLVSSACFSGTVERSDPANVIRELPQHALADLWRQRFERSSDDPNGDLMSAADVATIPGFERSNTPVIVHLAAYGANQTIPDGTTSTTHSPFVEQCLAVAGGPKRSFADFETELRRLLPASAQPEVQRQPRDVNSGFPAAYESAGPFRIE
jgi:hypothetical protein